MGSFLGGNTILLLYFNEIAHLSQLSFLVYSHIDSFYLKDNIFIHSELFYPYFIFFSKLGRKKKDEDDSEQAMDKEG